MFKEYDFSPGIVTFNNYDIARDDVLNCHNLNLTEDMLQVKFKNDLILDVGWYFGVNKFIVYVIKQCDWQNPMLRIKSDSYDDLKISLDTAMNLIKEMLM